MKVKKYVPMFEEFHQAYDPKARLEHYTKLYGDDLELYTPEEFKEEFGQDMPEELDQLLQPIRVRIQPRESAIGPGKRIEYEVPADNEAAGLSKGQKVFGVVVDFDDERDVYSLNLDGTDQILRDVPYYNVRKEATKK